VIGVIAAAGRTTTVVVDHGSDSSWWIPLLVGFGAALASYYATWRFKKADVNRENAIRAADLVDEAERLVARADLDDQDPDAVLTAVLRPIQQARVRSEPLANRELDDRFIAVVSYLGALQLMAWQQGGAARHWLAEAIANVRAGLVPQLAAPRFIRPRRPIERSFPRSHELDEMARQGASADDLFGRLIEWRANRAQRQA
jgi:hypothetical protein